MRRLTQRDRGSRIVRLVDPFRRRAIHVESGLEEGFALVQIASSTVRKIREQQKPDHAPASKINDYHVDFLTTYTDRRKVVFEVKYAADVTDEVKDRLKLIASVAGDDFADAYRIVTEKDLSAVAIANARLIVDCGCDADLDAQAAVREAVAGRRGGTTASRLGADTGLGDRGVRAAFALIQSGLLKPQRGARLDRNTPLTIRDDRRAA